MYKSLFEKGVYQELPFIDAMAYAKMLDLERFSSNNSVEIGYYSEVIRGAPMPQLNEVQWVHFEDNYMNDKMIRIPSGFALVRNFHNMYPTIARMLIENINDNLGLNLDPTKSNVSLARSMRDIARHRDVARRAAINCFIQNAELASTNFYKDMNTQIPFHTVKTQTGKSYLIDSDIPHDVRQVDSSGIRYFLTINIPYTSENQ